MSTKEQVVAAARVRYATREVFLDEAKKVSVTVRELSRSERKMLNARLFVTDEKTGEPISVDAEGKPDAKGGEWQFRDGVHLMEEWLAAAIVEGFTVEELLGDEWPESLKREIYKAAHEVNGFTIKEAVGN